MSTLAEIIIGLILFFLIAKTFSEVSRGMCMLIYGVCCHGLALSLLTLATLIGMVGRIRSNRNQSGGYAKANQSLPTSK